MKNTIVRILLFVHVLHQISADGKTPDTCINGCSCTKPYYKKWKVVFDCNNADMKKVPQKRLADNSYLILRGNKITDLKPEDFNNLDNLYGLDLRDNPIKSVTIRVFSKLRNLRELLISADSFHRFAFDGLTSLEKLHIEGASGLTEINPFLLKSFAYTMKDIAIIKTKITKIDLVFAGMKKLEALDLSENLIESVSENAFVGCLMLSRVILRSNKLRTIPVALRNQYRLSEIDMASNLLSTIDKNAFKGITRLQKLDLSHNNIKELDANLLKPTRLRDVRIEYNQLTSVPTAIIPGLCYSIIHLGLGFNYISELDTGKRGGCIALETLVLAGNPLTSLKIAKMDRIERLDISKNCKLKTYEVDKAIGSYDLSENCLSEFPSYLTRYVVISKLNLYGNRIKNFTVNFLIADLNLSSNGLEKLAINSIYYHHHYTYDLSNNKLKSIEIKAETFKINRLLLNNNLFSTFDFSKLEGLQILDLSDNRLTSLNSFQYIEAYASYDKLTTILLQRNRFTEIKRDTISNFKSVAHLDLSQNLIKNVSKDAFRKYSIVKTLNFSNNKLTNIPMINSIMYRMENIDLSNNLITSADGKALVNKKNIRHISLSNNKLTTMPRDFCEFKQAYKKEVTLDLSNNKLKCSCDLNIMLSFYGKVQPIGTCLTKGKTTKQLTEFAMTSTDLFMKSKCNLCEYNPCKFNGICTSDKSKGFTCNCFHGYVGRLCEIKLFDCLDPKTPCQNGGTCFRNEYRNAYTCTCQSGYTGERCESKAKKPAKDATKREADNTTSHSSIFTPATIVLVILLSIAIGLGVFYGRKYRHRGQQIKIQMEMADDFE